MIALIKKTAEVLEYIILSINSIIYALLICYLPLFAFYMFTFETTRDQSNIHVMAMVYLIVIIALLPEIGVVIESVVVYSNIFRKYNLDKAIFYRGTSFALCSLMAVFSI